MHICVLCASMHIMYVYMYSKKLIRRNNVKKIDIV